MQNMHKNVCKRIIIIFFLVNALNPVVILIPQIKHCSVKLSYVCSSMCCIPQAFMALHNFLLNHKDTLIYKRKPLKYSMFLGSFGRIRHYNSHRDHLFLNKRVRRYTVNEIRACVLTNTHWLYLSAYLTLHEIQKGKTINSFHFDDKISLCSRLLLVKIASYIERRPVSRRKKKMEGCGIESEEESREEVSRL